MYIFLLSDRSETLQDIYFIEPELVAGVYKIWMVGNKGHPRAHEKISLRLSEIF